jgi:hypothetical protein
VPPATQTPTGADADARAGLWLAVVGVGLLPLTIVALALAPQGTARAWVFLVGLTVAAAVSIWGGMRARRSLTAGTSHTARALIAAIIGFVVGVTAALVAVWSFIGLAS